MLGKIDEEYPSGNSPTAALSAGEKQDLKECESILEAGLSTFFEVGNALLRVREQRLNRCTHTTFSEYCRERWGISRSYAWRVLGAAERLKLLPAAHTVPKPENEFQIRPFLKLEPLAFPGAWVEAIKRSGDGKVTPKLAKTVVCELLPSDKRTVASSKPARRRVPLGKLLVLLNDAKRKIEKRQLEDAVAAIDEIERLFFSAK